MLQNLEEARGHSLIEVDPDPWDRQVVFQLACKLAGCERKQYFKILLG